MVEATKTITALLELCHVYKPWLLTYQPHDSQERKYLRFQTEQEAKWASVLYVDTSIARVPWTVRIWHRGGQITDAHYSRIEEADKRAKIERSAKNTLDVRIFRA